MGNNEDKSSRGVCTETEEILASMKDGVILTDDSGIVLMINSACSELTGISSEQLVGENIDRLADYGLSVGNFTELIETKKNGDFIQNINGREFLVTGSPVFSRHTKSGTVMFVLIDTLSLNELISVLQMSQAMEHQKKHESKLTKEMLGTEGIVAKSAAMKKVVSLALKLSQVDCNILITGETGVGKEVVARLIYRCGKRHEGPYIKLNCGAIPETMLESELFGYEPGAFTGAKKEGKPGLIELAGGGTLFLDEIAELPVKLQVKLLRVLQDREVMRVGGIKTKKVDFRLIAATNKDLEKLVRTQEFRPDLYYRLNVISIKIPSLRERKEDIVPLIMFFLDKFNKKYGFSKKISLDVIQSFQKYDWPGNIRELENAVERLVVISDSNLITQNNIMESALINGIGNCAPKDINDVIKETEKQLIGQVFQHCRTTRQMADALGVSQSTVVKKIKKYGLTRP